MLHVRGLAGFAPAATATMVGDGNYGGIYRELQRTSGGKLTDATRQSYLNATQNALTSQEAVESATRNANAVGGQITGETPRVKDARAQVATEVARNKSESDASTFDTLAGELKAQNDARVRSAEAIAAAQKILAAVIINALQVVGGGRRQQIP